MTIDVGEVDKRAGFVSFMMNISKFDEIGGIRKSSGIVPHANRISNFDRIDNSFIGINTKNSLGRCC